MADRTYIPDISEYVRKVRITRKYRESRQRGTVDEDGREREGRGQNITREVVVPE